MKINDNSTLENCCTSFNLATGEVYKDCNGNFVLACDQDFVVVFSSGELLDLMSYNEDDVFQKVNAVLEIK